MKRLQILLVDSSVYSMDLLERRLKAWGMDVALERRTTEEALRSLNSGNAWDMAILDSDPLLPDALEILKLRNRMELKMPVVALTDNCDGSTVMLLAGNGMNAFLKRQEIQKLHSLVNTLTTD